MSVNESVASVLELLIRPRTMTVINFCVIQLVMREHTVVFNNIVTSNEALGMGWSKGSNSPITRKAL